MTSLDWFVFPIKPLQKHPPLIRDNLAQASNDASRKRAWGRRWPNCNWGLSLAKSHIIVVDVDRGPGKRGQLSWDELQLQYGWPPTFAVATPSGGLHYYYSEANGVTHKCRLGVHGFGLNLDVPNYVLLAGSTLRHGTYVPINNLPVADAPAWFGLFLKDDDRKPVEQIPVVELDLPGNIQWAVDFLLHDAQPSIHGRGGEKALFDTAAVLKDHGISQEMAVHLIDVHYNKPPKCDPVWLVGEGPIEDRLEVKVANAYGYATKNAPGSATPQADFADAALPSDEELKQLDAWWKGHDAPRREKRLHRMRSYLRWRGQFPTTARIKVPKGRIKK